MQSLVNWKAMLLVFLAVLVVAGCGDDDRDETVPTMQISAVLTPEGVSALNAPVKAQQVELAAILEAGATLRVSSDRQPAADIPTSRDPVDPTLWRAVVPLEIGNNILTVSATDQAGNIQIQRLGVLRTEGPLLTAFTPAAGAEAIDIDTGISLTFDEEVGPLSTDSFQLRPADGELLLFSLTPFDPVSGTVTLQPSAPLAAATVYLVVVSPAAAPIQDLDGNNMLESSWTFTTK